MNCASRSTREHKTPESKKSGPGIRVPIRATRQHRVCLGDLLDYLRHPLQERAEFLSFRWGEFPNMETVTEGLDDHGSHANCPVQCSTSQ